MSELDDPSTAFFSIPKAFCPKASPDGKRVICNWNTTGRFELHAITVSSGERRQLTEGELPLHPEDATYCWTATSDVVLYQVDRNGNTDVYRVTLNGNRERAFTVADDTHLWAVNPKMDIIYYRVGDNTLRWRNPVTEERGEFPCFPGLDIQIQATCSVSPDGEWIAYTSVPPEADESATTTYESGLTTYISRADGSNPTRISASNHGYRLTPVQWHPDGERLLIHRDNGHWKDGRKCGIYDRHSGTVEWIADVGAVAFLYNGERILAGAPPRSATELYDVAGNATAIPCEGMFHGCNGTEAVVGDTGFIVQRHTVDHPYEVLHHDTATGETTVLFGAEYEQRAIGPDTFVKPTEVQYEIGGGEVAEGRLFRPVNHENAPTPAIVFFHGQRNRWARRFRPSVQHLAHQGYAVLLAGCPADGWSHEAHAVFAAAGRWLAQQEGIDPNRVIAYGHSHGGYNVYMQSVAYPAVWDAFVADTGCVDLRSAKPVGNLRRQLGDPIKNQLLYRELSPITYVDEAVGSPLLMIHGADDGWADQPHIFTNALKDYGLVAGDEYEHIEFSNVGHTPKSREKQVLWWDTIVTFLDNRLRK
ncbi:S9 family peptidase [Halocatena halophila]|uniref:S9 family peptidase n=1 Tax=Halocatena halophila TaxID=2814576 RepID=UPI002ED183E4